MIPYLQHSEHEILKNCVESNIFVFCVDIFQVHHNVVLEELPETFVLASQEVEEQL